MIIAFGLQGIQRFPAFCQDFLFPSHQLFSEIFALTIVHKRLVIAR